MVMLCILSMLMFLLDCSICWIFWLVCLVGGDIRLIVMLGLFFLKLLRSLCSSLVWVGLVRFLIICSWMELLLEGVEFVE